MQNFFYKKKSRFHGSDRALQCRPMSMVQSSINGLQRSMCNDKAPLIVHDKAPLMGDDGAHDHVNSHTKHRSPRIDLTLCQIREEQGFVRQMEKGKEVNKKGKSWGLVRAFTFQLNFFAFNTQKTILSILTHNFITHFALMILFLPSTKYYSFFLLIYFSLLLCHQTQLK